LKSFRKGCASRISTVPSLCRLFHCFFPPGRSTFSLQPFIGRNRGSEKLPFPLATLMLSVGDGRRARVLKTHANVCLCVSRGFRDLSGSLGGRLGILVIDGTAASLAGTDDTRGETRTELYSSVMPARPNQAESGRIDAELCRRLIPPNRDSACRAFLPITRADHRALVDPPVTSVTGLPRIRVIGVIDVIDEGTRPTISPSMENRPFTDTTVKRT